MKQKSIKCRQKEGCFNGSCYSSFLLSRGIKITERKNSKIGGVKGEKKGKIKTKTRDEGKLGKRMKRKNADTRTTLKDEEKRKKDERT